ncbi:polysaccharide biosynthesis protein [Haloprofundus marisrubri]|uniref:Polysaccharide biosynthesis protein n=1 Tax=Haloprofundus marisrubri TaxID=1514971 RepID=A0A0W1R3E4_9EURY|nr:flippase [Haloprofundus marisrubri]KTG07827.1 polysaccharide biosynthesis protein [Haloprofundus marisrubri]
MGSSGDELKSLLSSASLVIVGGLVGSTGKLAERVIIGRELSPADYGEVSIGLAVLTFVTTLSLVGFTQGVPRYLSRYESDEERRGVWVSGIVLAGAIAVVVGAGVFASAGFLTENLLDNADSVRLIQLFGLAVPFVVGMQIGVGAIRGHENTVYKTYVQDLLYPIGRIVLIFGLLSLGYGVVMVGYAYLVAAIAAFVLSHVLLSRLMRLRGQFRTHTREMLRFSAPLVISTVMSTMLTQTDTLMLGYFRASEEAGMYSAAYTLGTGMLVVLSAFGFLYLPLASRLDSDGQRDDVGVIYQTTTKWVYIITFPAFLTFVVFPRDILRIVFGSAYESAALALIIVSIGFFLSAAVGRDRETLSALGETNYILVGNVAGFVFNFLVNLVLIPQYGMEGAAFTSAVSMAIVHVVVCGILKLRFDITPFSNESVRTFVLLPVVLIPPALVLSNWVSLSALTLLPFLVVTGLLGIGVVTVGGALQAEDLVVVEFVEDRTGVRIPLVRRYFPA